MLLRKRRLTQIIAEELPAHCFAIICVNLRFKESQTIATQSHHTPPLPFPKKELAHYTFLYKNRFFIHRPSIKADKGYIFIVFR